MNKILLIKFILVIGFMALVTVASVLAMESAPADSTTVIADSCIPDITGGKI